jgi:hypothetical protein
MPLPQSYNGVPLNGASGLTVMIEPNRQNTPYTASPQERARQG